VAASLGLGPAPGVTAAPAAPAAPADDGDPARSARAVAAASGKGSWQVRRTGPDTYRVSWRAPRRLPVTSDRATIVADGVPVGVPLLQPDGRTVETTVVAASRPDPAELDVLLSGDRLDHRGLDQTGDTAAPAASRAAAPLPDDPAAPGSYAVVTSDYELDPVKLPRMREPIEMVGHVVEPAADAVTGPRPLVVFLHGRHSYCYSPTDEDADTWSWPCQPPAAEIPSHLGYDYIQQVLASQGFTTVSIRVNGINAQDFRLEDGGADARSQVVQRHLDHWTSLAAARQVDLSRVVLVGHSRGGEGVNRASIQIPLDAPYRVVGQVLLAPTDFGTQTAPYVPTVTVLPYCDGDVFDLQGQRFTDSARDLTDDDTSLKSSVLVMGANHNFFNTEWTPGIAQAPAWDDWFGRRGVCGNRSATRLEAAEQRTVGVAYVAGAARLFAQDADEFLALYDGSAVEAPSIGDADVRSHAIGGGRDVRRPAKDTGLSLPSGAETSFCQGVVRPRSAGACGRESDLFGQTPHWYDSGEFAPPRRALQITWDTAGETGGLVLDEPLDLTDRRLELRTIVDPTLGDVALHLRLTDATGATAEVTPEAGGALPALPLDRQVGKRWAQAVLADPAGAAGVDLTRVTRVDVVGDSPDGRIWVLDLAAAPATLAAVPEKRMPTVSLGRLRVPEGDSPATSTAWLPFTVTGDLTRPAQLVVGVVDEAERRGRRSRLRLDLAPGQTEGAIRYEYEGNTIDDWPRRLTTYGAYAVEEVMTDAYYGRVDLLDDDPAPRLRVRAATRVREGDQIRISASLSRPTGYFSVLVARAVKGEGPGRRLAVGDLPAAWARDHFLDPRQAGRTLHGADFGLFEELSPGERRARFRIPVRRDGVREGVERLTLRFQWNRSVQVRTFRVVD
jgi:dienelactone hydrolase